MNHSGRGTPSIKLNGGWVTFSIRESRTARKRRIRVTSAGVEVILPRGSDPLRAVDFLRENAAWVLKQLAFMERLGTVRVQSPKDKLDALLLRGREMQVEIVKEPSRRAFAVIEQDGAIIRIRVPKAGSVDPRRALEAWLRRQARQDITDRLTARAVQMKVKPGRVYIMDQRTKWGGCSHRRNLSFSWRLVMAPPGVLDYIVVHELAHLIEPYHSTKFWLVVRSHCPDYEKHKTWLRENQRLLGLPT